MFQTEKLTNDRALAREYVRFMQLKFSTEDFDATKLFPSAAVDSVWHHHILDTKAYQTDCLAAFGKMMHHSPHGETDGALLEQRYERTLRIYQNVYGERAPDAYWPREPGVRVYTLNIRLITGRVLTKKVNGHLTVRQLKTRLHKDDGCPSPNNQRLIVKGAQLLDHFSVLDQCLNEDGEPKEIYLMRVMTDC